MSTTEVTPRLRRFIEIMAAERTRGRSDDLFDECVQEGMISAWQAMETYPGKDDTYYRAAARNGVMKPILGRAAFGHESQRGKKDASSVSQSIWASSGDGEAEEFVIEPMVEAPYDSVEVEGAVRAAVAGLDEEDRRIVWMRYWEDLSWPEVGKETQTRVNRLQHRWMKHLRPALAEALAPLAS